MATAMEPRGESRRHQIVEGAQAAIPEQPIADVQLASIAAHAGLKPNHVLYYFASRDAVLIAAVAHAESQIATGRSERLRAIADPAARLAAYVRAYLPVDRHDPVWKLWIEGWVRSASHDEFAAVGRQAGMGWHRELVEAVKHALAHQTPPTEDVGAFARRFNFFLDGLAVHVLAGHITSAEGTDMAMRTVSAELRIDAIDPAS
jgi:AcrR family transcriptional regulator